MKRRSLIPPASATALAALLVASLLADCAPREARYDLSDRAAAAPPPKLLPTQDFAGPTAGGAAAVDTIGAERTALAARAAALQGRAAGLSAAPLLTDAERARLQGAQAAE